MAPLKESQFLLVDTDLEPEAAAKHYQGTSGNVKFADMLNRVIKVEYRCT